jgi:hypothetical protein
MWFAFGLITLVVALVCNLHTRMLARWSGSLRALQRGLSYEYNEVRQQGKLRLVRMGLAAPGGYTFKARKEGMHDSLFKFVGVSVEMQVQDQKFDAAVYLESDAKALGMLLAENDDMRAALLSVFEVADALKLRRMRVRCLQKRLWVEFSPAQEESIGEAARRLVPSLNVISKALKKGPDASALNDPFVLRAAILLSISSASAILGTYGLLRATMGHTDILDISGLFIACLTPGLCALGVFLLFVLVLLGQSSRAHLVLLEALLVGGYGFLMSTFALAHDADIAFDVRPAHIRTLSHFRVEDNVSSGRRGKHHRYYLYTEDWRPSHTGETLRLEIDHGVYDALNGKHEAKIETKPGALDYEWVGAIQASGANTD